jgi:uncharacterized membrane protein YqjE
MHPLFRLLVSHPTAVTDHVEAYAALAAKELSITVSQVRLRALMTGIALCCAATAMVLGGVAVMLWSVTPPTNLHAPWALWVVPGVPAVAAVWCWLTASAAEKTHPFSTLRAQVRDDLALLREVNE